MIKEGCELSKLEVQIYGKNFRGVHALEDIHKGEIYLRVPWKMILTVENMMDAPVIRKMLELDFQNRIGDKVFFIVYILV